MKMFFALIVRDAHDNIIDTIEIAEGDIITPREARRALEARAHLGANRVERVYSQERQRQ
jgi:hypothetical protein